MGVETILNLRVGKIGVCLCTERTNVGSPKRVSRVVTPEGTDDIKFYNK